MCDLAPPRSRPGWLPLVGLVVALGPRPASAEPATPPTQAAPDDLVPPVRRGEVVVEYPPQLLAEPDPPTGEVVVELTIGIDGVPRDLRLVQGVHPGLDEAALALVAGLRYEPATVGGRPVEIVQELRIPYVPPAPAPDETPDEGAPDGLEPAPDDDDEPEPEPDPGPVRLSGTVLEAGQRTPIAGASIVAVPADPGASVGQIKKQDYTPRGAPDWQVSATSDAEGRFDLRGRFAGKIRVVVLAPGFERLEFVESLPADQQIAVKYFARRMPENPYRTVVEADAGGRQEVARRRITVEEINALPGTQGDALKAIQNFPGVARSPFGIGFLAIRGTGPNDSAIYLGHHEIPTLFHFGGLTSVFNSDILERIDFVPGNFDSRYGDAIGGIIDVQPRPGRRDGYHGYVDSDIFDTGVLVEGPVGKGSFALSGRRSYIDFLLPVFIPDDAGLDLTIAPRYYDYQGLFDYPLGGGDFSVRLFGSDDRTKLVASDPNEVEEDEREQFETTSFFHRADLVYERRAGPWRFLVTPSYRLEFLQLGLSDFLSLDLRTHNLSLRAEVERRIGRRSAIRFGTETIGQWFRIDVTAPPLPGGPMQSSEGDEQTILSQQVQAFNATPALYSTLTLGLGERFTLLPGVRAGVYTLLDNRPFVDPRLNAAWQVADRTTLKAGVGLYTQAPQPVQQSEVFGNPRVWLQRGIQTSVGVQQQFDYGIDLDATAFFNWIYDQPTGSDDVVRRPDGSIGAETFANTQTGRVYGGELLVRKQLTGSVFGWVAYTLSRSERRPEPGEDFVLFDFDQTHILTLIGVYRLPKNWQVGARFRLVSGNPYTPVVDKFQERDTYIPILGPTNSARLPPFHQLDLRVDKRWIWKRASLTLYLDVQNVYNHQNPEFVLYAYDFSDRRYLPGLPIIPSVGTKVEF